MARRAFVFQLYRTKRWRHLHGKIDLAAEIHNHLIALQKRYYRRFKGYIGYYRLKRHGTKLKRLARFAHWKQLDAQAIQNIVWRIDQGYQKFFRKENKRPPTFRCLIEEESRIRVKTGQTAGFDFGLTTFLTGHNGHDIHAPQPLRLSLRAVRKANRALSRKMPGSQHRRQAKQTLSGVHRRIAHQRQAWHWDTAQALCQRYDTIYLEDLELRGMASMWGRKVADVGFGRFVQILHQAAEKFGTHVHHIDRFFPSTKRCHVCGFINHTITLRDRLWTCPCCGTTHRRDRNAATNIYQEGASSCIKVAVSPLRWLRPLEDRIPRAVAVGVRQRRRKRGRQSAKVPASTIRATPLSRRARRAPAAAAR